MLRRSPRALALWGAALVVALITAAVVGGDLASLHRRAHDLGPEQNAVQATHDLAVGDTIQADDLSVRPVHRSQLPAGVIDATRHARGRVVTVPVLRGGFVTERNLASRRRSGLDGVVPPGMRAIRVIVTDALRPRAGAAVDVLATYDPRTSANAQPKTIVVAAGVLVLDTDTGAANGGGRANTLGVTLLVDPDQARDLADAETNGVMTLALVPPEEAHTAAHQ
ncbi:MAG TPA: Flp pilus assembly protein CpaB [Acidimicrobiia bacterium]